MAKYYYNGVLLPEIPADVLEEYPFCYIFLLNDGVTYKLIMSKSKPYFDAASGNMYVPDMAQYKAVLGSEKFTVIRKYPSGYWRLENGVVWSNHDIPNGSATSTDIYFYGSDPVPESGAEEPEDILYSVHGSSLTAIADSIRGKTGKADALTLEQMVTEIEGIETGGGQSTEMFTSSASGILPTVYKGTATSEFTLNFESSATGALSKGVR